MFNIQNRRYTGSKYKLTDWIKELINDNCEGSTFFDVFAGTGVVTNCLIDNYDNYIINDFLYSNEVIYNGFFLQKKFSLDKLKKIKKEYNSIDRSKVKANYISENFGDKFFNMEDAKLMGFIRADIEKFKDSLEINNKEYFILIASLLYSMDKVANTVGHYDAYIKNKEIKKKFEFDLIEPVILKKTQSIKIFRQDANNLVRMEKTDIAFIDPPHNSRQYSRFYHLLENIAQWKKPELSGVALKPKAENISDYCKVSASKVFASLINDTDAKYIVVTYNNTYNSKSTSSKNKMTLKEIEEILNKKGETKKFEKSHNFFNAGKTDFTNHKEYVYITKVVDKKNE